MCVFVETMCMMFIIPAAQCDLNLTLSTKGILSSVSFCGVVAGSYIWGYIADTHGRRTTVIISLLAGTITTLLCTLVPWAPLFIVLRFLNGLS